MRELTTKSDFLGAVSGGELIVITRKGSAQRFHRDCDHLKLEYFEEKVITHGGKHGKYFAVTDLDEARRYWPSIADCWK